MENPHILSSKNSYDDVCNYNQFCEKISESLSNGKGSQFIIIASEITQLSAVNELYGFEIKNKVFEKVYNSLKSSLGKSLITCTYGPSVILMFHEYNVSFLEKFRNIKKIDCTDLELDFAVTLNSGMFIIDDSETDVNVMINNALLVLNKNKSDVKSVSTLFTSETKSEMKNSLKMMEELKNALKENQISVFFQPQYKLKTGELCGSEVVCRWLCKDKEVYSPGQFIPVAEKSGLIFELDKYICKTIFEIIKNWIKDGLEVIPVSINLSSVTLNNEKFITSISSILKDSGIPGKYINFEIKESAYTKNPGRIVEKIEALKKMGFFVGFDDYGMEDASLKALKEAPVDFLKIDLSFIKRQSDLEKSEKILSYLSQMCRSLGIVCLAQKVENDFQRNYINSIECDIIQGFACGKLLSLNDFSELLYDKDVKKSAVLKAKIESKIDIYKINDPNSSENIMFEVLNGPAAIVKYDDVEDKMDLLRCNKKLLNIISVDNNNSILEVSRYFYKMFDGQSYNEFLNSMKEAAGSEKLVSCVTRYDTSSSKSEKWIKSSMISVGREDNIHIIYILFEDVTDQKLSEDKLNLSNEQMELLIENTQVGICLFRVKVDLKNIFDSLSLKVIRTNKTFQKMSGYSQEEALKWSEKDILNLVSPIDRPIVITKLAKGYFTGFKKPVNHIYKARCKDGGYVKVKFMVTGIKQPDNSFFIISNYIMLDDNKIFIDENSGDEVYEKLLKSLKF